jgi:signal-transduction protein with cAMP-binding, CBS, and nucleotidyltransferase domain
MNSYLSRVLTDLKYFREFKQIQGNKLYEKMIKTLELEIIKKDSQITNQIDKEPLFYIILEGMVTIKEDYGPDSRLKEGRSFGDPLSNYDPYQVIADIKQSSVLLTLDKKAYSSHIVNYQERIRNRQLQALGELTILKHL